MRSYETKSNLVLNQFARYFELFFFFFLQFPSTGLPCYAMIVMRDCFDN
jgi:hypothetical protein